MASRNLMRPMFDKKRRRLLYAGLAAGIGAAGVWRVWPEQGIVNPCRGALPQRLANHEIVQAAWSGIDSSKVWDCHAHLVGTGDSGGGIWINPEMESLLHPQYAQRLFYLNAGCAVTSRVGSITATSSACTI